MRPLLLYDTRNLDLARDIKDFCVSLDVQVDLIPMKANSQATLGDKEMRYINNCTAAIFLVTPQDDQGAISDSVIWELGQLRQKFSATPEKVIVLADETCRFPPVEQKPRNQFRTGDCGSVVRALTLLIEDLKTAGLVNSGAVDGEQNRDETISLEKASQVPGLMEAVVFMSTQPDTAIWQTELDARLRSELKLSQQQFNFVLDDLSRYDLARKNWERISYDESDWRWRLSRKGLDLARKQHA